jgi:hypothetical protein
MEYFGLIETRDRCNLEREELKRRMLEIEYLERVIERQAEVLCRYTSEMSHA